MIEAAHGSVILVELHQDQNRGQCYASQDHGKDGCACVHLVFNGSNGRDDDNQRGDEEAPESTVPLDSGSKCLGSHIHRHDAAIYNSPS